MVVEIFCASQLIHPQQGQLYVVDPMLWMNAEKRVMNDAPHLWVGLAPIGANGVSFITPIGYSQQGCHLVESMRVSPSSYGAPHRGRWAHTQPIGYSTSGRRRLSTTPLWGFVYKLSEFRSMAEDRQRLAGAYRIRNSAYRR